MNHAVRATASVTALVVTLFLAFVASHALAHQTITVGEGPDRFDVVVGFTREPIFTDERNALDLIIRRTEDREPIEGLARSLNVEITAPDGVTTRPFTLRAQYGQPGRYTDDIVLSAPGVYTIRIFGFVGDVEVDVTFETHEVGELGALRFP
jgi:hypothetical protein